MDSQVFAQPWLEFEEEFGERPLIFGPLLNNCFESWAKIAKKLVSVYTFPAPDATVRSEDRMVDGGLRVRVYTPEGYTGDKPVGVYYHGGGWAMGNLDGDDFLCANISKNGGVVLVAVDYGLAPQNKHPGLIDDCYKGLKWTLENSKELGGIDGKIFTVGGSAGAGLALGAALRAIDEGLGNAIVGVVAQAPVTVHPAAVPSELKARYMSMEVHKEHSINTASAMLAFWDAFGAPPTDPYASPLLHTRIGELKRVYLAVMGHDTLRDDGLLFKEKLDESGVPNKLDLYEGYPHYFWTMPSSRLDKPRQEYNANLATGVQFIVGK